MFHSAHPIIPITAKPSITLERRVRVKKARQSDKRRGLKVVKEEEEKQQGHKLG
jgi:hypothetical protein